MKTTIGRVRRRTSTKHRSMALVVRSFRHRCGGKEKNGNFSILIYLKLFTQPHCSGHVSFIDL